MNQDLEKLSKEELIKLILNKNKVEENGISGVSDIIKCLRRMRIDKLRENFIVLFLSSNNKILEKWVEFLGSVDKIGEIYPKVILSRFLKSKKPVAKII